MQKNEQEEMEMALRATDGVDDKKIIVLNEETAGEINKSVYEVDSSEPYSDLKGKIRQEFSKQGIYGANKMTGDGVIIVDQEYDGKEYDLNSEDDFNELRKGTDQTYYIKEGDGDMIVYMNGMNNDEKGAKNGAKIIENLTNEEVSIIHNDTDGIAGDFEEYIPNGYTTKDVLNAKVLEDVAKNGDETNTVIAFSAGNEDLYKAMQVMELEGRELESPVDVISVGSPRSKGDLEKAGESTGFGNVEQYNDWKDPVTNPKKWVAGATALTVGSAGAAGVAGAIAGGSAAGNILSAASGLEMIFNVGLGGAVGGAVGFGGGKYSLNKYHSFEGYVNRNVGGVKDAIESLKEGSD